MQWEDVRLLCPRHLDLEPHPDRDPKGHGCAEGAVRCDASLHAILANRAEGTRSEQNRENIVSSLVVEGRISDSDSPNPNLKAIFARERKDSVLLP
jgi:hypothetical protein